MPRAKTGVSAGYPGGGTVASQPDVVDTGLDMPAEKPTVLTSLESADGFRCVDIFRRADGTFGFKEFRRDPEDAGRWTLVADYSDRVYPTRDAAVNGAASFIAWLAARS